MGMLGRIFIGGLGWAFAGPIGGLIGWWIGGQLEGNQTGRGTGFFPGMGTSTQAPPRNTQTRSGYFGSIVSSQLQ